MKIVYTIAGLYRRAGMERILTDKANFLAGKGYDVIIVTTEQRGRPIAFPLDERIRREDLAAGYEDDNGGPFLSKALRMPVKRARHRLRLTELLLRESPDITVSMFCGDEGFLPSIKDGSKKVLEVHFSRFKRLQYGRKGLWALADRLLSWRDGRCIRKFDRFVTLTGEDLAYWGMPENGVCIPNFINHMPDFPAPKDSGTVLAVGRFCHQKGFDRLIQAWKLVKDRKGAEGWNLQLIGGGEDMESLKDLAATLAVSGSVEIQGQRQDMDEAFRGASVFALSSRYEGLPMVLLEAQAWGLPIVSFDCKCGPRDIVTDGVDGFLVEEGNVEVLADRLSRLIDDPGLVQEMGSEARKNASRWDKETIMKQWTELFASI